MNPRRGRVSETSSRGPDACSGSETGWGRRALGCGLEQGHYDHQPVPDLPRRTGRALPGTDAGRRKFGIAMDMAVYFCDPGAPWHCGTNENTNVPLRQYFPRNSDLRSHDAAALPGGRGRTRRPSPQSTGLGPGSLPRLLSGAPRASYCRSPKPVVRSNNSRLPAASLCGRIRAGAADLHTGVQPRQ